MFEFRSIKFTLSMAAIIGIVPLLLTPSSVDAETPQIAQSTARNLKLSVKSICKNGDAYFQVTNNGKTWPRPSKISLYRTNADTLVSQRRMRLKPGQKASFKVKKAAKTGLEIGLWVQPEWFTRPFKYDAKVTCR